MSLNKKDLPNVLKQARSSVYNMGVVCDILQKVCQDNRAIHDELKATILRLRAELIENKRLKHALAESEKDRLLQATQEDSVVNENDSKLLELHQRLNETEMKLEQQAQVIANEKAKTEEYQKAKEILEEQNKMKDQELLNAKGDKQREAAVTQVKIDDVKNQRKTLQDQILRLQDELRNLRLQVDQAKGTRIELEDLRRKINLASVKIPNIKEVLKGSLKYNSNIKF